MRLDPIINHGWYWSFGWLRRPEFDQGSLYCYEEPDGQLWLAITEALYLDCRKCMETGELYCSPCVIPKRPMKYDPSTKSAPARRNAQG
jgi:hypothetical protein